MEGVIKYTIEHSAAPPLPASDLAALNAWRKILNQLALIGQDPARYDGVGFGNISCRLEPWEAAPAARPFAITGTQTGHLADLTPEHFTVVTACHPERNTIVSAGLIYPSSEALTHGTLYALDPQIHWVMHAHAPHIWRHAAALGLPQTRQAVLYGTPEMAAEVARLFVESDVAARRIFSMAGHEDGIVTFGASAEEAGAVLVDALAAAYALEQIARG